MGLDQIGNFSKHLVTIAVPIGIIDRFEVIHIDQQQRERTVIAVILLNQECRFFHKDATVEKSHQRINDDPKQNRQYGVHAQRYNSPPPLTISIPYLSRIFVSASVSFLIFVSSSYSSISSVLGS